MFKRRGGKPYRAGPLAGVYRRADAWKSPISAEMDHARPLRLRFPRQPRVWVLGKDLIGGQVQQEAHRDLFRFEVREKLGVFTLSCGLTG